LDSDVNYSRDVCKQAGVRLAYRWRRRFVSSYGTRWTRHTYSCLGNAAETS